MSKSKQRDTAFLGVAMNDGAVNRSFRLVAGFPAIPTLCRKVLCPSTSTSSTTSANCLAEQLDLLRLICLISRAYPGLPASTVRQAESR